ncbi:MAG TPA: ATP-binding protein [Rhodocyclaceae bacterium]|nr:ATP-binding protein [Rhodocyclaceae bacterium]
MASASRWSVRTFLVWLVLACLLPGVIGATVLFIYEYREGHAQLQKDTLQTTRALAQTVDSYLLKVQAVAQALSTSDALARRDFALFHRQARQVVALAGLGTNVVLRDESGQQILNTLVDFGQPLPRHALQEQVRSIFANGRPTVSDLFIGPVTKRPIVSVYVPVTIDGKVAYALAIGIQPEHFNAILKAQRLPTDWMVGVFDSTGTIVGRTHSPERLVGHKANAKLLQRMIESSEGWLQATTSEGIPVLSFYSRAPVTSWRVAIGIPRKVLEGALLRSLTLLALGVAALFGSGLVLAWIMGGRIASSVTALIPPAIALGNGRSVPPSRVHLEEADRVAEAIGRAARLLQERTATLRESEERLQLFIRYAPAALAMFNREMCYLAVSRRWVDDYLLGEEDVIGRSHYEIFPDIPKRWREAHDRGLAGEVVRVDEDHFRRADGTIHWLRWEVRPWHTSDGAVGGIVIFTEDITRYKQALEEIHRLNADLERRVEERTAELTLANRELDSFAYAISHDLRAPLRAVKGFSQILEESYASHLSGDGPRYLQQIRAASQKMSDLIDGILTLSRVTRGELRCDDIDLSAMAERLLAELQSGEPERRVRWDVEPGLAAQGDARMMESVMANLLENAWKYTARTPEAFIRVYREDDHFCISDNGAGFDPSHAANLFQPFRRLHRQEEFPGIGIGLATVQRIIRRHGGEISATAAPGQGATFRFRLGSCTTGSY